MPIGNTECIEKPKSTNQLLEQLSMASGWIHKQTDTHTLMAKIDKHWSVAGMHFSIKISSIISSCGSQGLYWRMVVCDITIFMTIRYPNDSYDFMPIRYDTDNFLITDSYIIIIASHKQT